MNNILKLLVSIHPHSSPFDILALNLAWELILIIYRMSWVWRSRSRFKVIWCHAVMLQLQMTSCDAYQVEILTKYGITREGMSTRRCFHATSYLHKFYSFALNVCSVKPICSSFLMAPTVSPLVLMTSNSAHWAIASSYWWKCPNLNKVAIRKTQKWAFPFFIRTPPMDDILMFET